MRKAKVAPALVPAAPALMPEPAWTHEEGVETSLDPAGRSACATV